MGSSSWPSSSILRAPFLQRDEARALIAQRLTQRVFDAKSELRRSAATLNVLAGIAASQAFEEAHSLDPKDNKAQLERGMASSVAEVIRRTLGAMYFGHLLTTMGVWPPKGTHLERSDTYRRLAQDLARRADTLDESDIAPTFHLDREADEGAA